MSARHLKTGKSGEDAAVEHLKQSGYKIIERNSRQGPYELDVVCRHGRTLVFVEIRTRDEAGRGHALEALGKDKQAKVKKAAQMYLSTKGWSDKPCRFDYIAVTKDGDGFSIDHVTNVFAG